MTPDELFNYAVNFCQAAEEGGRGSMYPTFRQVASKFKVTYDQIEQACDDWQADAYMAPAVGMRSGTGVFSFSSRGEHLVEAYR